jgi:hypothetical protein
MLAFSEDPGTKIPRQLGPMIRKRCHLAASSIMEADRKSLFETFRAARVVGFVKDIFVAISWYVKTRTTAVWRRGGRNVGQLGANWSSGALSCLRGLERECLPGFEGKLLPWRPVGTASSVEV